MTQRAEEVVTERVGAVALLSERELREEESFAQPHAATHSPNVELHDFRVELGVTVLVVTPNPLLMGVWARLGMIHTTATKGRSQRRR